jgi:EamA-like transporter family
MEEPHPRQPNIAFELAWLLALATLWGASYTLIKTSVATIPPITLIAARTAIAGALLLAIMRWRGIGIRTDAATWRRFLLQASLNSVIPWTMIAWGERSLDAGLATILNSTSPIFTFFLTLGITRHEALTSRKLLGVVAGMAGICLIVGVQALAGLGEQLVAQIVTVLAAICYAGAAIFSRGFKGLDPAGGGLIGRGRGDPDPGEPDGRPALDIDAVHELCSGVARPCGVLHRLRLRDLFSPDPDTGIGRHHRTGLPARADRRRAGCSVPRREPDRDGVDRARLRRDRRGRDDDPGTEGSGGRRVFVTLLACCAPILPAFSSQNPGAKSPQETGQGRTMKLRRIGMITAD